MAKGLHHQQHGHDFTATFSRFIKSTPVRNVQHVSVSKRWSLRQNDPNNAFLQETLEKEVYVTQVPRAWYISRTQVLFSDSRIL